MKEQFHGRYLGDYRRELFGASARLELAASMVAHTAPLATSRAISQRGLQERQAELRSAQSSLLALIEQANLDVWTERNRADSISEDAQRRVMIARQHLASLLMNESAVHPDQKLPDSADLGATDKDLHQLSRFAIRAPMAGSIERRDFSANERVHTADTLFILADATSLWIQAEIRENDWPAMTTRPGQTLVVKAPALGDMRMEATVRFVGREVLPSTNAVPIVARICNTNNLLRPGLFVRVSVPVEEQNDVLTIPTGALLTHQGQSFVFVAESSNHFRRSDVVLGGEGDGRIAVVSGLAGHESVVTQGGFLLKSELLLEGE